MADYGKYDVIRYPGGFAVTDMQTHEWMHEELIGDQAKAHKLARDLQARDANYPAPPRDPKPGEYEPGIVPAPVEKP